MQFAQYPRARCTCCATRIRVVRVQNREWDDGLRLRLTHWQNYRSAFREAALKRLHGGLADAGEIAVRPELARHLQHDRPVHGRPEDMADDDRIALEDPFGDEMADMFGHGLARARSGAHEVGVVLLAGLVEIE